MKITPSRTPERILAEMFRQIRRYDSSAPESPERLDPILRLLMRLFAHQIGNLDRQMQATWQTALNGLIRSVCPGIQRQPIPAHTIVRCQPVDPSVIVDTNTRFYYREEREGAKAYFFSPLKTSQVVSGKVIGRFLRSGTKVRDLSGLSSVDTLVDQPAPSGSGGTAEWQVWIAFHLGAEPSSLGTMPVYLDAEAGISQQLRWGYWQPGSANDEMASSDRFCPGLVESEWWDDAEDSRPTDWGGLRTTHDITASMEGCFVYLPQRFCSNWVAGPPDSSFRKAAEADGIALEGELSECYWLCISLPSGGDKTILTKSWGLLVDCLVAVNLTELTLFKHTGGSKLIEIEIPEPLDQVVDIVSVTDSSSREYSSESSYRPISQRSLYSVEERDDHLVLWFDFTSWTDPPPDSITVTYSVTRGTEANGIGRGMIKTLYEGHPGLEAVQNVSTTTGAIPARTEEQVLEEVSVRLRQRDRALTFADMESWTRTFDPRIQKVKCRKGVERINGAVCRCIVVELVLDVTRFVSDDEKVLLAERLKGFLKNRSTVNTQFKIQVMN